MKVLRKLKYSFGLCSTKGCVHKAIVDVDITGKGFDYSGCLCEKHYDELLKEQLGTKVVLKI